jgi:hypothetical protein
MEKIAHYYKDKKSILLFIKSNNVSKTSIIGWCGRSSTHKDYSYNSEYWTRNIDDVTCDKCKEEVGIHLLAQVG